MQTPNLIRKIAGDLLIAATAMLLVDVIVVMLRKISAVVLKENYVTIFRWQLLLCFVLVLFALDVRFGIFLWLASRISGAVGTVLRVLGWILRGAVILFTALILYFCGRVALGGIGTDKGQADHALVLGMALENGEPTQDLIYRVDTARDWLDENPESLLVLTGGNADESGRTEAVVMQELLIGRGVPESSMILEDKAESTEENFANTLRLVDPKTPVALITSNYHMDRAKGTAESAGFRTVLRHPAPSGFWTLGANVMWEVVLDLNNLGK